MALLFVLLSTGVGWGTPVAPTQQLAYVADGSGFVSVIDTSTNTVFATITVSGSSPWAVAALPNGTRVYVSDAAKDDVFVIDTSTNKVVAFIPVGTFPIGMAITPNGTRAYVANNLDNTVSVIDTTANPPAVVGTPIGVGAFPWEVAITPNGNFAYVTNQAQDALTGTVSVINTSTNTVVATIPVGGEPSGIAITPDGTRAYVANFSSNTVSVISTASNTVSTIPFVASAWAVAITPDGTRAYVTDVSDNTVSVIDIPSNTVTAIILPVDSPQGIAITPDGTRAYVTDFNSSSVTVIDTASNTVVSAITVFPLPNLLAITTVPTSTPTPSGTPTPPPSQCHQQPPRPALQSVLNDVFNLRQSTTNKEDRKRLDDVIKDLGQAIDPRRWTDQSHLRSKDGNKVFDATKDAVNDLLNLMKNKKSQISDATLQGFINRILCADHDIGQIAINDATAAGGDQKRLQKANSTLSEGDRDAAAGQFGEAIEDYRQAWQAAVAAMTKK